MDAWNTIVMCAGTALLIFSGIKELRRANKARLLWRLTATVIAVGCLVCMALPLSVTRKNIRGSTAIIVTAGADNDTVQYYKKLFNATLYEAENFFNNSQVAFDTLHVVGYGFTAAQWESVKSNKVLFHPGKITAGIVAVDWNRKIKKAEPLNIQGTYINTTALPVSLLLSGFNTILDTFIIPAKQTVPFQLHTVARQNGRAVYSIFAVQQKDTLEKEPVPVEVVATAPVKICMLSASPDFENKFLKNWLTQNGYTVVTKTRISANKFDKTLVNAGNISVEHITYPMLDSFDIVVSDEATLLSLSKSEQENIFRQVSQKGMGLLVKSDSITNNADWYKKAFYLYGLPGKQPTSLSLQLAPDQQKNSTLSVEQPLYIRYSERIQPLITDSTGKMVTGVIAEGAGKITLTTLSNTYSWLLAGKATEYYEVWSNLLQKTARQYKQETAVEIMPALPFIRQHTDIIVETNSDTLPVVQVNGIIPALAQNEKLLNQWTGIYWPSATGWQAPVKTGNIEYNWYVFNTNDWQYITANSNIHATKRYARQQGESVNNNRTVINRQSIPVPLVYFFLPFILCCGFLWMERKLF